jgi:salicylate biosynthesis isochorismate synthase
MPLNTSGHPIRSRRAEVEFTYRVGHNEALRLGRPVLTTWSREVAAPDPRSLLDRANRRSQRVFYWASRWTGVSFLATGTAVDIRSEGPERFRAVGRAWQRCATELVAGGSGAAAAPGFPLLVGGFAFRPGAWHPMGSMPDALTWSPAVQLTRLADGATHLSLNAWITPGTDPADLTERRITAAEALLLGAEDEQIGTADGPPAALARFDVPSADDWRSMVGAALRQIHRGQLTKVVLARQVLLHSDRAFAVPAALDRISRDFTQGAVFGAKVSGRWFLGATPECLVRLSDRRVVAHSLAGSIPRGATAAADEASARLLLDDAKTRHEQGIVTDFVTRTLATECVDVTASTGPDVMRLGNISHLVNTVTASVPDQRKTHLLDLVELLHPTPAVGGYPTRPALRWIARTEPFDRGWYAAPVGWLDASQDGEMGVAIRSALVSGSRAAVYAGCGIVDGSSPNAEHAETEVKLRPMIMALRAVQPTRRSRATGTGRGEVVA